MSDVVFISGGNAAVFDGQPAPQGAKGDPGSPGEGYATRTAMAARAAPALKDDVYLTEAGREGKFVVDAASAWTAAIAADTAQGIFVPSTADPAKVYRRQLNGPALSTWFGVSTAGTAAANSAAMAAALATLYALRVTGFGFLDGSIGLHTPAGAYSFSGPITLNHSLILSGDFSGNSSGGGTVFRFTGNTSGIVVTASVSRPQIRNLFLQGAFTTAQSEAHGIDAKSPLTVRDCEIDLFSGDCIRCDTSTSGNVNGARFDNLTLTNSRRGIYMVGADSNACTFTGMQIFNCRQSGIEDASGTGNHFFGGVIEGCGQISGFATRTSFGGNRYMVAPGQESGASTNAPTGTTASNTWWIYTGAGGADATAPAWVSGLTWFFSAPYANTGAAGGTNQRGGFDLFYVEGGQNACIVQGQMFCRPGLSGVPILRADGGTSGNVIIANGGISVPGAFSVGGTLFSTGGYALNGTFVIDQQGGFNVADDTNAVHKFGRFSAGLPFSFFDASALASGFKFRLSNGTVDGATLTSTGLAVLTGGITAISGGIGYATGAGGTVTQATSKATGVTLNKLSGKITMNAAALAASTSVGFTLTNSQIAATDVVIVNIASGATASSYTVTVDAVAAGSCHIHVRNVSVGSLSEAVVLNYAIIKGVNA